MGASENRSSGSSSPRDSFGSRVLGALARFEAWPLAGRLGAVVAVVALGAAFRVMFAGAPSIRPLYLTLYPAVVIAALMGGLAGGVLATFLSALVGHMLLAPLGASGGWFGLTTFLVSSAFIVGAIELLRRGRAQAQEALRALVDNLPDSAVYRYTHALDGSPQFLYFSAGIEKLNSVTVEEVLADAGVLNRQILPEFLPVLFEAVQASQRQGSDFAMDVPMRRPDGEIRWMQLRSHPVRERDGRIVWHGVQTDITEQKRAEAALRESNARLEKVLEVETVGVMFWYVTTGRMTDANDTFLKMMGYSRRDVETGELTWQKLTPPEYHEASRAEIAKFQATGRIGPYEKEYLRKDGTRLWLVFAGSSLGGNSCVEFCVDISARKKAEQEALASKAKLEAALSAMPDAVYISDAAGSCIHSNEACGTFHRFRSAAECRWRDVGCTHLFDAFTPDGKPILPDQRPVARALRGETGVGVEMVLRHNTTSEKWLALYSFAPIRDAGGAIVGSVVTTRDITAVRQTEAALHDEERRNKAMVDAALEGIVTIDANGIIQSANPATLEMYGYAADEMIGRNVKMLMRDPYRREHDGYIAHYLQSGEKKVIGRRRIVEGLRKNGEVFPKELTVTEARFDDRILFVSFMRDLSAIEAEKRRADDLRDELARVSRLNDMGGVVAGLAHEIGQPLAAIYNFANAARRMAPPRETSRFAEAIDQIEAQSGRAIDILRRLREFIQKRDSEYRTENLSDVIEEAVSLAFPDAGSRRVGFSFDLPEDQSNVAVDRVQIEQVLVNFLRNAAEAAANEAQPEIVIETAMAEPGFVRVSVSDNGPGVDAKIVDQLFNPFVTTKKSGMGVGLSICKTLIERHGGQIGYIASHPRGAVFWFTLPILPADDDDDDAVIEPATRH